MSRLVNHQQTNGSPWWFRLMVCLGCLLTLLTLCPPGLFTPPRLGVFLLLVEPDTEESTPTEEDEQEVAKGYLSRHQASRKLLLRSTPWFQGLTLPPGHFAADRLVGALAPPTGASPFERGVQRPLRC